MKQSCNPLQPGINEKNPLFRYSIIPLFNFRMKKFVLLFVCLFCAGFIYGQRTFNLCDYSPVGDGKTDDTRSFIKMFEDAAAQGGGHLLIGAGDYFLKGDVAIPLCSNTTVSAYGARFILPGELGDRKRIVLFQGVDITDFMWMGGYFKGYCYDPDAAVNRWEPNVTTRMIVINTSKDGVTDRITFRDMSSDGVAGAVVNVNGFTERPERHDNTDINFASNISVLNCTFINSGKFMWDYGYLWQLIVFAEESTPAQLAMAKKYFRNDLIREHLEMQHGSDRVVFSNTGSNPIPVTKVTDRAREVLCFYGMQLPDNIVKGKQYFVVESTGEYIKVSDTFNGKPIVFQGSASPDACLIWNLDAAFYGLYAPTGEGPGKGCIDLTRCKNTFVSGCKISASGDAMHIYNCHNNIFSGNHILGARMGAFFLAEYCKNSTITGNTVDGCNGSRVMTIEESNEDVTVIGNTFRNGGRGGWGNQPKNLIIQGNIFINNTNKGTKEHNTGRRSFKTGGWQAYPEIYFTTYQEGASYGPVVVSNNVFYTGPDAAAVLNFEKNGVGIRVEGNIFKGSSNVILIDAKNKTIQIDKSQGATIKTGREHSQMFANN